MRLAELMSHPVVTVEMDDRLHLVKEIFDHTRFHHLVVLDEGKLAGVLSDRDLFKAMSPYLGTAAESRRDRATLDKRVHQIMSRPAITLERSATVAHAVALFHHHKISCIPVVEPDGGLCGIVSWRDLLPALLQCGPLQRNEASAQDDGALVQVIELSATD
ncbi:CBS domain-containing protein [Ferrimonas pelagia]|uniref:CBS domain-containing protein n=1 Tax=Ferrimonas pelagia TaxID=1177826 RepID=A0ABP9FF75_9GAMM